MRQSTLNIKLKIILIYFKKHFSMPKYILARALLSVYCGVLLLGWMMMVVLKRCRGGDLSYASSKTRGFWWSFKFCVFGIESGV